MEKATLATQEAEIAEQSRLRFIKHTSGALRGKAVMPSIQFGKRAKELAGLERLQRTVPGLAKAVFRLDSVAKSQERQRQLFEDVQKQRLRFERSMADLANSSEKLTTEQVNRRAAQLKKGISPGDQAILNSIKETSLEQLNQLSSQTDIQSQILKLLSIGMNPDASREDKDKQIREQLRKREISELRKALAHLPQKSQQQLESRVTGIDFVREHMRTKWEKFSGKQYKQVTADPLGLGKGTPEFEEFTKLTKALVDVKNNISDLRRQQNSARGSAAVDPAGAQTLSLLSQQEEAILKKLMQIAPFQKKYMQLLEAQLTNYLLSDRQKDLSDKQTQSEKRRQEVQAEIARQRKRNWEAYKLAEMNAISGIQDATNILKETVNMRLASVASDFAKTLEGIIDEFKKAEALEYEKVDSDLDGPFARVGKPGFKTDFEKRKEEAEKTLSSGATGEERKTARTD